MKTLVAFIAMLMVLSATVVHANPLVLNAPPRAQPTVRWATALARVKIVLNSAHDTASHHDVRILRDPGNGRMLTCLKGRESARSVLGDAQFVARSKRTASAFSCVAGTDSLTQLAISGSALIDSTGDGQQKRINPETGEEEDDFDFDYFGIEYDLNEIDWGVSVGVPPSACIADCNSRLSSFYARCRSLAHPAAIEACMALVASAHAACIIACYM